MTSHREPVTRVGKEVVRLIKARKMKQAAVAASMGVSTTNLTHIIHSRWNLTPKSAIRMAEVLRCSSRHLMRLSVEDAMDKLGVPQDGLTAKVDERRNDDAAPV